jgi:hypothetical protein
MQSEATETTHNLNESASLMECLRANADNLEQLLLKGVSSSDTKTANSPALDYVTYRSYAQKDGSKIPLDYYFRHSLVSMLSKLQENKTYSAKDLRELMGDDYHCLIDSVLEFNMQLEKSGIDPIYIVKSNGNVAKNQSQVDYNAVKIQVKTYDPLKDVKLYKNHKEIKA